MPSDPNIVPGDAESDASSVPLRMLSVHAHPDDEASKGAPTVAKYLAEGIPATLVCCTGGECGDILNPAMDRPEVREHLVEVRAQELAASVAAIGYDRCEMLGYRDSGMPDTPENAREDNFWNAPLDEAVGRLVAIIRRDRPQVIVTYGDDQRHYAHPDHLKVHDITLPAFDRAGDPDWYPEAGPPWQPLKLYYTEWSPTRIMALHGKYEELGVDSPFAGDWIDRINAGEVPDRITTRIDIVDHYQVREAALLAHATQVDPKESFWFGLPSEVARDAHPFDDYVLARSLVGPIPDEDTDEVESDLFAGVPESGGSVHAVTTLAARLGHPEDARLLIVNCDDLGMCHSANEGVYSALRDGLATSATLMVPCPWAREAASQYRGEDVGVHLTLNAEWELYRWGPITVAPSLLGGDGGFPRTVEDVWDHADLDEVRRELRSQIERAILWGFDVTHLDSHMGTLQMRPEFFDVYLDLAVDFGLPVRLSGRATQELVGFPFRDLAEAEGVIAPDHLVYYPGVGGRAAFEALLDDLRPGVTEIFVHPATDHAELRSLAPDWERRVDDHRLLTAEPALRARLADEGVIPIGWRELRRLQRQG